MDILYYLITPNILPQWLVILKIFLKILCFILLIFIIFLIRNTPWVEWRYGIDVLEFLRFKPFYGIKKFTKQWIKIKKKLDSDIEEEYKLAVLEADSIFGDVLKKIGYTGENLDKILENLSSTIISNIEEIKQIRQTFIYNIINNPEYKVFLDTARKILSTYEKCFQEMELI